MGGGAAKPFDPTEDPTIEVKHNKPFHVFFTLACKSFDNEEYEKLLGKRARPKKRRVVVKCRGDIVPYTCESFRRLCCGEGGDDKLNLKGTYFHNSEDGNEFRGGRFGSVLKDVSWKGEAKGTFLEEGTGVSKSGFGGRPFESENFELDHKRGSVSLAAQKGDWFGSEFFVNLGAEDEFGSQKKNEVHVVFGEVMEGIEIIDLVGELMQSDEWDLLNKQKMLVGHGVTGRPIDHVWIEDCGEIANYLAPTSNETKRKNTRRRQKRSSGGTRQQRGSITKRNSIDKGRKAPGQQDDDDDEQVYASVIVGQDDNAESTAESEVVASAAW